MSAKVLSIPPHLSVAWSEVSSLGMEDGTLVVTLSSGKEHKIAGLKNDQIEAIFAEHAATLNTDSPAMPNFDMGFGLQMAEGPEGLSFPMQHNPDQADAPDIPADLLQKIVSVSEALGIDNVAGNLTPAEPHCNCVYCQIARAFHGDQKEVAVDEEIEVTDDELTFRDEWIINPTPDNKQLYLVINPLNEQEQYSVFLGKPIGCTCGHDDCEHVRAVLNS